MSKFCRCTSLHDHLLFKIIIFFMLKQKLAFCCQLFNQFTHLSVVALPIVPKVEFIFEIMFYITFFLYKSPGSCFKSTIGNQNSLESTLIILFLRRLTEEKILHQKSLMTKYTLILIFLRQPKH